MKLSVIIPFYKEISIISRTVESVLSDDYFSVHLEIIICNDGPFFESDIRNCLTCEANKIVRIINNFHPKGPGGARNSGLDVSTGNLIAFLDADDIWLKGKFKSQLYEIQKGATFVTSGYRFDGSSILIFPPLNIDKPIDIFYNRGIGTSTVLTTRELVGNFRFRNLRFAQDIDYWYLLACSPFFHYSAVTACYVQYSTSGTTKNKLTQLIYFLKVLSINKIRNISRAKIIFGYVLSGAYNHFIRRLLNR